MAKTSFNRLALYILAASAIIAGAISRPAASEVLTLGPDGFTRAKAADSDSAKRIWEIRQQLAAGHSKRAVKLAKSYLKDYSENSYTDDYELAMSLRQQGLIDSGKLWKAYGATQEQLKKFPAGKLVTRAFSQQLTIASRYLAGEKRYFLGVIPYVPRDDALEMLIRLREAAGTSQLAMESIIVEAEYYAMREQWPEAFESYLLLRKAATNTETRLQATLLAADMAFNVFEGIHWDDTPLLESKQLYLSYLAIKNTGGDAEHASARLVEIENLLAEKDYSVGRYYNRTGNPESANYYYRQVVELYPGTKWAKKARQDIGDQKQGE